MIITDFEKSLSSSLEKIVKQLYQLDVDVDIQKPKSINNGMYTTNIAMKLRGEVDANPREIATSIVEHFELNEFIKKIDVAGPGFINIYTTDKYCMSIIEGIDSNYGQHPTNNLGKYLVEFVSANPTGDLHLGHARGGIYGDSLIRVMRKAGYDVTSEYYLNDAGNQMNNLGQSTKYFYLEILGIEMEFPADGYRGKDIKNISLKIFDEFGDSKKDEDIEFFTEYSYGHNMKEINKVLKQINISFDNYVSERELYASGKVASVLEVLNASGDMYQDEGATWLATSKYIDDKDRAIVKSDGTFTYFAADIAYHLDKFNRGYDHLIDIWGADHHGYVPRVLSSIQSLGKKPEALEVPIVQMVSVLSNNEKVKMSKRAGTSVTISDLLEEIDAEALRYFFIMRSLDTQLDFDIQVAAEQSMDNPIYYIQYANARISSVLKEFDKREITKKKNLTVISPLEEEIISHLSIYPKVITEAAEKRLPHLICNYLYELASMFHKYYNQERVFTPEITQAQNKQIIYSKVQIIFKSGLDLLGIIAKDEM